MPERRKSLLEKYAPEQIRGALARMTARDNTRTANAPAGYLPAEERPLRDRSDIGIDEGVMGLLPGVGDVLQGGQALIDLGEGRIGKAALGVGLLFVPNALEKPAKLVKQGLKSGMTRYLRHQPLRTIGLDQALTAPYRGQNFIHHDVPEEFVRDVLKGETRVMSPSLAVNRWGDYNDLYTPGFYDSHVFIGDKSMLDKSRLFRGDGMTPTVREIGYPRSVPSDMREKVAEDVWKKMEREGNIGANTIDDWRELERLDLPSGDLYFEAKYHGAYPLEDFRHGIFPEPKSKVEEDIIKAYDRRGLPIDTYRAVGGNEGYNNKIETLLKVLNENPDYLFAKGGKVIATKRSSEKPEQYLDDIMPMPTFFYTPHEQVVPDVRTPLRYYPQPNYGDYEYPVSTGMMASRPIWMEYDLSLPVGVQEQPEIDYFSPEMMERRAVKQRWAESGFRDKAVSKAGAQGAWQIMPITYKDYLGRGKGKAGDLNNPEYNRKVRDWVMGIIPRDLGEFYSESDAPLTRLAKLYGAYNWGAGNMRKYLRKQRDAGVDINNGVDWVEGLNPETKRYIKYLAFDEDIPDSTAYTNSAFEKAAMERGYLKCGGKLYGYGGDTDDGIYLGELQPSVKLAEEPLFVETPYTRDDFFKRWYPNRQEQLANNLAFLRSDRSGWPFGQKRRALKNVEGYTQSMLRNMDENLKEYSLIPSIWSSAYPHNSAYDPNRKWYFPDALKDDEARKVLEDHVRSKKQVLKNYGVDIDDKITDNDLRGESYGNYGFSYSNDPYHIFYSSAWPSDDTIVHERTHALRPLPGEYEKYGRYFGNTPMEFVAQDIKTDQRYHKFFSDKLVDNLYTKEGRENEDIKYLSDPHEIVARLNAIRFNLGINPNRTITPDDLKEIRARASKYDKETFLDLYTDEALLRFFNEIAANNGYADLSNIAASGGKIHIAPSKKGTFTAAAKKHGKSVQAFASQVLAHKENYSPAMVKKANFARNAVKWHGDGGIIDRYPPDKIRQALAVMKAGSK